MSFKIGILTERMILGYGVDLVVNETCRRLADRKYDVTVFATNIGEIYDKTNYNLVDLSLHAPTTTNIFSQVYMQETLNYLSRQNIDIWIIHTPPFYRWLEFLRPPVILVEHGSPPGKYFSRQTGRMLDIQTYYRYTEIYQSLRPGDGLVAISNYIASEMPKTVGEKSLVVHNGADHYPRASVDDTQKFRENLQINNDEIMVLWVGRIQLVNDTQPYKGLGEFLAFVPSFIKKFPQANVVMVGKGDKKVIPYLESLGIKVCLNLDASKMAAAYAAADIYLNTSKWEGFNLPLIEAQFQGTPAIAYNLCAHPEVVRDGDSGILVNNEKELLIELERLIVDKNLRLRLAGGARKFSSLFSWDKNVEQLESLMKACHRTASKSGYKMKKPVRIRKTPKYYWCMARMIVRREGWGVLIRETLNSIKRRLKREK